MLVKFLLPAIVCLYSCSVNSAEKHDTVITLPHDENIPEAEVNFVGDIPVPKGYDRLKCDNGTFVEYLSNIKLKRDKTVYLYNGEKKVNQSAQYAVLDIPVGERDLQQCADAVMRLRAEYLFAAKRFNRIEFFDNNHKAFAFEEPFTRDHFEKYLTTVFGACGSASLSKQLGPTDIPKIKAGDVFIRGGFPGHAVIVMDVVQNEAGEKMVMLAQSYMPAQDIHLLKNPLADHNTPWFELNDSKTLITPEYVFLKSELMSWD